MIGVLHCFKCCVWQWVHGLLKICMLIYQALPRRMHISFFGKAYVMYRPDLVLVHENPPH